MVSELSEAFTRGSEGTAKLAERVVATIEANPQAQIRPIYELEDSLETKVEKLARNIYGADGVNFSETAKKKIEQFKNWCFGKLPVCVAKTQYSFSDNPKLLGAPSGWTLNINDATLSAGAGFVVMISGNMMLMPGLPKAPRALTIDVNAAGEIIGV